MEEPDPLLVIEEMAEMWRMPENTVRYKKSRGELPFIFRMGKRLVATRSDCVAYVEAQKAAYVEAHKAVANAESV